MAHILTGVELIAAERTRQETEEGWTAEHDDNHVDGEIRDAATCYLLAVRRGNADVVLMWPWETEWWKPSPDPVRNLVKAGALIAAEIDRLLRAKMYEGATPERILGPGKPQ